MPGMKGTEFLKAAKDLSPLTPRIMVAAYQDASMMEESINQAEVFRFLTKTIDVDALLSSLKLALRNYAMSLGKGLTLRLVFQSQ